MVRRMLRALPLGFALSCAGDPDPMGSSATQSTSSSSTTASSDATSSTTQASTSSSTDATSSSTSGATLQTTVDPSESSGCSFLDGDCFDVGPDCAATPGLGTRCSECDVWAQDCPDGQKCMPWANDGGNSWNATRCSPIDDDAAPIGDPCMNLEGGVGGIDTCEKGSMCYYVDPETGVGVCVPFCTGSPDAPMCASLDEQCSISNGGVLILCRKLCNPLAQDCEGSAACLLAAGSDKFVCIVDASGDAGVPGDPCEYLNACDPGSFCANPEAVPGCQAGGCCTDFCDLDDPNKDAQCSLVDMGVTCQPFYEPGTEPAGLENVGACVLPP